MVSLLSHPRLLPKDKGMAPSSLIGVLLQSCAWQGGTALVKPSVRHENGDGQNLVP